MKKKTVKELLAEHDSLNDDIFELVARLRAIHSSKKNLFQGGCSKDEVRIRFPLLDAIDDKDIIKGIRRIVNRQARIEHVLFARHLQTYPHEETT